MAEAGTPAPSAPAQPVPGAASTDKSSGDPRTDSQARIDQLVRQKNDLKRQMEGEAQKLREELAELRGKVSVAVPAPTTAPESWAEMNDAQLSSAKKWARENDNGASLDAIYREEAKRLAAKAADEAVIRARREIAAERFVQDVHAGILRDVGPDAFDPESQIAHKSDEHYTRLAATLGKERISDPVVQAITARLSILEGERATKTLSEREQTKKLQEEHRALQAHASLLERGGPPAGMASQPNDAVKTALAAGDRRAAIKGLKFVQAMAGQAKADALKPRG